MVLDVDTAGCRGTIGGGVPAGLSVASLTSGRGRAGSKRAALSGVALLHAQRPIASQSAARIYRPPKGSIITRGSADDAQVDPWGGRLTRRCEPVGALLGVGDAAAL